MLPMAPMPPLISLMSSTFLMFLMPFMALMRDRPHLGSSTRAQVQVTGARGLMLLLTLGALLGSGVPLSLNAQPVQGVPAMSPPLGAGTTTAPKAGAPATKAAPATPATAAPPGSPAVRTIGWEALVPADWDPMKDLKGLNMSILSDADPRAAAALAKLREAWDNAPINPAIVGQAVRLPGYLVPLEETKDGMKEFLLVPYFGACIHSPPPPANQIVHVLPRTPAKGLRSMDTVWVTGVLTGARTDSYMGTSGYRIEATQVAPYAERPAR